MENEKNKEQVIETTNSENEEIIIEEIIDDVDDNEFLKSLEEIDKEEKEVDEKTKEEQEEAIRIKNKNAEEARKRREAEAKARLEEEAKAKEEKDNPKEEATYIEPQQQVKDLVAKYPDIDLGELDKNEDFQEYLEGKWVKGGKTILDIYEGFIAYTTRLTNKQKEEVEKQYQKKGTPSLKGSSGSNGSSNKVEDVYTQEELLEISKKMPFMNPKQYASVEEKYERSIKHYRKK